MSAKFIVNGKEYDRIEDMPEEIRKAYQAVSGLLGDADQNGIPDILEGKGNRVTVSTTNTSVNIVHDGKVYTNVADLPPEVKEKYQKAMKLLSDSNQNGIPNILETAAMLNAANTDATKRPAMPPAPAPGSGQPTTKTANADQGSRTLILAALVMLILAVAAVLVVLMLVR